LVGVLFFPLFKNFVKPSPRLQFIFWGLLLLLFLDVFLPFFHLWQSTFYSRVFTGLSLGMIAALYTLPAFFKDMNKGGCT
jgi:hypothetical protein